MKKKTVKVKRHVRSDGAVVEAHDRVIETEEESLSEDIRRKKREKEQANLLESFLEEN